MTENTGLDVRMKRYENAFRNVLPNRSYVLLRLDGWAFHTYLRGAEKPFDRGFINDMNLVTLRLCEQIQGVQFAFTQSDEISLLITDFDTLQTEPWCGNSLNKLVSLPAAMASAYMTRIRSHQPAVACFDCRAWAMSDPVEVANYFVWRQRDAVRNSIQMVGQVHFSPAELNGQSTNMVQEMLWSQHQVNWDHFPPECKRGRLTTYDDLQGWATFAAPRFEAAADTTLAELIPALPSLRD